MLWRNAACVSGVCTSTCRSVAGTTWCYDASSCGNRCNAVCAALGLPLTISNAAQAAFEMVRGNPSAAQTALHGLPQEEAS